MALFPPPATRDAHFTNAPEILDAALEAAAVPSNTPALATCIDASPTLPRKDAVRSPPALPATSPWMLRHAPFNSNASADYLRGETR